MKKNKVKIVGIKIDTKSDKYKDKIYYIIGSSRSSSQTYSKVGSYTSRPSRRA